MRTMFPSLRLWSAVALLGLLVATNPLVCRAQDSAASLCAQVLQQGIYNVISQGSTMAAYSNLQSALCEDYSSYSFTSYSSDRSALDSAIDSHAGSDSSYFSTADFASLASSYCGSKSHKLEVAAKVSYLGFGASGSYGESDNSAACGAQSNTSYTGRAGGDNSYFTGYMSKLSSDRYSSSLTSIQQTQSTMCGSNSAINQNSAEVQSLSKVIDPSVFTAYISCLSLYTAGLTFRPTFALDSHSVAFDLSFKQAVTGATAYLSGVSISPPGTASCTLLGFNKPVNEMMNIKLEDQFSYSIHCSVIDGVNTAAVTNFTDIYLSTTASGTHYAQLPRKPAPTQVVALTSRILWHELDIANSGDNLASLLAGIAATVEQTSNRMNQIQSNTATRVTKLNNWIKTNNARVDWILAKFTDQTNVLNDLTGTTGELETLINTAAVIQTGTILQHAAFPNYAESAGFLLCDGAAVSRDDYSDLFAVIGEVYGAGDGYSTFNVPDLRGRVVLGAGDSTDLTSRGLAESRGEETYTLMAGELPPHTHTGMTDVETRMGSALDEAIGTSGSRRGLIDYGYASSTCGGGCFNHVHSFSTGYGDDVAGEPHNNMQPSLVVSYIIKY